MKLSRRRLVAGTAATVLGGGGFFFARGSQAQYYDGPASDHFDGVRFFDPYGAPPKHFTDLLRWHATRQRAEWPERLPSAFRDTPPRRVDGPLWRISFVGHASVLLQTAGRNILIDPVWSERASPFSFVGPKRVNDPGVAFDALPPIDAVLVSHCHYDHLDVATLAALATPHRPRFIMPLGNDSIVQAHDPSIRCEVHDWGERVDLGNGVAVIFAPIRHWSARGLTDRNKALWCAFVIETPAGRIFHVADTGYGDGHHFRAARQAYGPFRLAVLPVGAYEPRWFMKDQHINPAEAVQALQDCGAELALGHHYGTFQLTDEPIDAPARDLAEALNAAGVSSARFRLLAPGEVWEL